MALTSKLGVADATLVGSSLTAGSSGVDPLDISLTHSLGLLSFVGVPGLVTHTIFWSHTASFELVIGETQNLVHSLGIGHMVESALDQFLEQEMTLVQTVDVVTFSPIVHTMLIDHGVVYAGPVAVSVAQSLGLTQVAGIAREESVTQNLGLSHFATDVQKHELNLTHSVMAYLNASPHFEQDLGLTHSVQVTAAYDAQITHTDVVTQALTYYIDDGTSCPGNDFNNWGTLGPEPFTAQTGARLVFQNRSGTDDLVVLKNPELDDRDRIGYTRVNRETRGGELQMFRDPTWPLVNTVQGTIIGLKKQDVEDWQDFMNDHLGEEISMADWHGRYWRGVIINPGEPAVEDTRDRWTVAFEFEGIEMDGPDVIQQVGVAHVLEYVAIYNRPVSHDLGLTHLGRYAEEFPQSVSHGPWLVQHEIQHSVV